MSKITFALAATLLAGTTMTSAANADAVRVGFGFPLGSFVAHSNETYSGRDYQRVERPRSARREVKESAPRKIVKVKRPAQSDVAETAIKAPATATVQPVKLEGRLPADTVTTAAVEKTAAATTTGAIASTKLETSVNGGKVASDTRASSAKADAETAATTHICRRYSPAIAALIDVPCD
ncbi:hypothetical protein [Hyphomicrobium sp. MC8b]|uniref:hypothetical protein n=1 Tax=Hyphomicrobium sp. MC8b TaxID=300273 RepID=UPI00391BC209